MKHRLVISTSPRVKSNSDALADEFIHGKKILVLAGKAQPKVIREDKLISLL